METLQKSEIETAVWDTWTQDLDTMAEGTKDTYLRNFRKFRERWDVTPGELYEMRKADLNSAEPLERKRIERMIRVHMSELSDAGYAASTCSHIGKAVSSFFESLDLEIQLRRKDKPRGESNGQIVATGPQIRKMYDQMIYELKLRNKAVLLSLKDNGVRISDLREMDYGDWVRAETIPNGEDEAFKVFDPEQTTKMKVVAYIHMGPESVAAVEEYLEDRRGRSEILTEETPLFIGQNGERISVKALTHLIRRQSKRLGLKKVSAHSLRKFHRTRLEGAGMPESWVKKLQGKAASVYSQPEKTGELTERYLQCYDALRVLERPIDEGEIEVLREELERSKQEREQDKLELKAEIERSKQAREQLTKQDEDLARVEAQLALIVKQVETLTQKEAKKTAE